MSTCRVQIRVNFAGPTVSRPAWKMYQSIIARMKKSDSVVVWFHDKQLSDMVDVPVAQFTHVQAELRDAGFIATKQSANGCEYRLSDPCQSENPANQVTPI